MASHLRDGLCSRCIARFSLLEPEDGEEAAKAGEQVTVVGDPWGVVADQKAEAAARPPFKARFGDYELLEEIAHGGMGVVYRARQVSLNRIVAVKMLLFGQFAGKTAFDRFSAEAETAARLQHPNIVAIHGIGETDGQPYFSMDYVTGRNLAELGRDRPLPARQAAGYVRKIAQAVQYAHTQGVLHRDLKPANVLIDEADEPRVTDFGLARRLAGDSQLTLSGQVIGSPNFMPPEQGAGKKARLTPASDVYGLGALLYYLLTARPPFVAETFEATLEQVLHTDPVPPRQLNPGLPGDLETICLKCLEKDAARRYASAAELAEELDLFTKGEPIRARPVGSTGKLWRWCRRRPVLAAMTGAILTLLVALTAVSLSAARRVARHARELRLNLYVSDMNVAYQAVQDSNLALAKQVLNRYLPENRSGHDSVAKEIAGGGQEDLRGWEWRYLWKLCRSHATATLRGHASGITCALFTPDGRTLITASFDRTVRIWHLDTKRTLQCLTGFAGPIQRNSVAVSPNGNLLAVADGIELHIFETKNWSKVRSLPNRAFPGRVNSLPILFSKDGETLWCNANGELRVWDTTAWNFRKESLQSHLVDFGSLLARSPNGQRFAVATDQAVVVCDASFPSRTSELFRIPVYWPMSVIFSPDSKLVVVGGPLSKVIVWDAKEGREVSQLDAGLPAAFSPDSRRLVTGGVVIRLWDIVQRAPIASFKGSGQGVLAFAPDGQTFASGDTEGTVALWAAEPGVGAGPPTLSGRPLGLTDSDRTVAVLTTNSAVEFRDCRSRSLVRRFILPNDLGARSRVVASPNGRLVASVATNGLGRLWETDSQKAIAEAILKPSFRWPWAVFSPDSRLLAVSSESLYDGGEGWAAVWDLDQRKVRALPQGDYYRPSISPDGRILATGSGTEIQLWSLPELKPIRILRGHTETVKTMVFSPDSSVLASSGRGRDIWLWDLATGRSKAKISVNIANTFSLAHAFSPDGRTLVSSEGRDATSLWNVATSRQIFKLAGLGDPRTPAAFASDGNTLIAGGETSPIEFLEAPSMAEIEAEAEATIGL